MKIAQLLFLTRSPLALVSEKSALCPQVEAASAEEAEATALDRWETHGAEAFNHFNDGHDGATAEEK